MRIGIVTGEYPPMQGGVGAYSHILAQTFVQMGNPVYVFSTQRAQNLESGITLTNSVKRWSLSSLRAVKRWANTNKLDVVSLQFQTAAYQMSPFIHFLPQVVPDTPVVTTFHDLRYPYLFPKAGRLRGWIVMHLARTSAGVIVTNHEDFERVEQLPQRTLIPIGSNILTPLPHGFDRKTWRVKVGAYENDLLVAHFGFVNRSKGLETLLHSVALLREGEVPVKLVMVGGRTGSSDPTNAAYAAEIDALIVRLGLASNVCWTGFVEAEAVRAYLEASDVVVLPFLDGASYRRGSLMAAVHHACAIITTVPQVPIPTFVDGENLLLVPAGNVHALAEAVRRLYHEPELRQKLRCGAKELDKHFDWSTIAHDCITFFERLIRDRA